MMGADGAGHPLNAQLVSRLGRRWSRVQRCRPRIDADPPTKINDCVRMKVRIASEKTDTPTCRSVTIVQAMAAQPQAPALARP